MAKKLYTVTAEVELGVYADDENDAEEIARDSLREVDSYEFSYHATQVTNLKLVDSDLLDSLPWGRDEDGDRTMRQIWDAQQKILDEQKEQEEIKRVQPELPFGT